MIENSLVRLTRMPRRALVATMALVVSVAAIAFAAPAMAVPHGEYVPFADCPLNAPHVVTCLVSNTTSGQFTIGSTTVPINKTITLQGGLAEFEETVTFVAAADGNTLSKTALTVPGGLLGIVAPTGWPTFLQEIFNNFINEGATGVTATAELAAPASSIHLSALALLLESGTALTLPVKVHLSNPFLGSSCYIGSNSHPINLNLTTGATSPPLPNHSIHGARGTLVQNETNSIANFVGNSLVDNSFSTPGASGCGGIFSFLVDPAVNLKLGLPSPAGHNTAILTGTVSLAEAEAVRASE